MFESMDMIYDVAAGVFLGGAMLASVILSLRSFAIHDHKAPWLAYFGFLFPVFVVGVSVYLNAGH